MPDGARSEGTAASHHHFVCPRDFSRRGEAELRQESEVPGGKGKQRQVGGIGGGGGTVSVRLVDLRTQLKENHYTSPGEIQAFGQRRQKQQKQREVFQKHALKSRHRGLASSVPQGHGVLRLQQQYQQPPVARSEEEVVGCECPPARQGSVCPRFALPPHGSGRNKNVNITLTLREAGSPPARDESRSMFVRPGHDLARVRPLRVCRREETFSSSIPSPSPFETVSQGSIGVKGQTRARCPKRLKVMPVTPRDTPQRSEDTEDALLLLGRLPSLSPLTTGECRCKPGGEADGGGRIIAHKRSHRKGPLTNSPSLSNAAKRRQQEDGEVKKEPSDIRVSPSPHKTTEGDVSHEELYPQARSLSPTSSAAIPRRHSDNHHHHYYHLHRRFRSKNSPSGGSNNISSGGGGGWGISNSSNSSWSNLLTTKHSSSSCSSKFFLASLLIMVSVLVPAECGNPDAKRLYDDLLSNYNKLVRPVVNVTDVLTVRIKLKLSQLIDVNLKSQIMTTNLWVEQYWYDYKLIWEPKEYGGVEMLHVPSDHIWRPDIVLYNNADGNFEVTLSTKATLAWNGLVEWKPPAIYKSSCEIDVEYFPFDEQTCVMKFGSWTYDGFQVDLRHLDEIVGTNMVEMGVDLSEFYMSVEWDILEVPAVRHEKFYTCCDEPYLDITFNITMRRKTLFYTVNLIIPCMGISFLTVLTFYLPSDSGEKVTLSISILISLHVFFLLVVEIIPPTSLVVPLLGKYLIFAMILVSISICVTVLVLNVHFRSPQTHKMAPWVRRVFIHILPRLLIMKRPQYQLNKHSEFKSLWSSNENSKPLNSVFMESNRVMVHTCNGNEVRGNYYRQDFDEPIYKHNDPNLPYDTPLGRDPRDDFSPMNDGPFATTCRIHGATNIHEDTYILENSDKSPTFRPFQHNLPHCSPEVHRTCWCVSFIAEHTRLKEDSTKVKEDWKYVAMVLDRLFLWIFTLAVLVGTAGIILQAPSLYDDRIPLDKVLSEVYRQHHTKH